MNNQEAKKNSANKSEDILEMTVAIKNETASYLAMIKRAITNSQNLKKTLQANQTALRAKKIEDSNKLQQLENEKKAKEEAKVEVVKSDEKNCGEKANNVPLPQVAENKNNIAATKPRFEKREQRPYAPISHDAQSRNSQTSHDAQTRTRHFSENNEGRNYTPQSDRRPFQRTANGTPNNNYQPRAYQQNGANGQRPYNPSADRKPYNQSSKPANGGAVEMYTAIKPKLDTKVAPKKKVGDKNFEEKKSLNKKALMMRGFIADESLMDEDGYLMGSRKSRNKKSKQSEVFVAPEIKHAIITTENLTVKLLAEKLGKPVVELIKKFMLLGMMVNINSNVDFAAAELVAGEFGITLEQKIEKTYEEKLIDISADSDDEATLTKRPPIITVLGHVDHGKTSLLDYIRNTNVIAGEAGGITQHIGAYTINKNNELITFIDTPGHAAFAAMRARGAKLTDIAILVVAADDGVMPQTIEAIKYIKDAKVPMLVAINKIDKPEANIDRIKQQLSEHDVVPEEWGGDAILIPISAKTGQGIDKLLEMVLFVAEYQNLKANPKRRAIGSVIEAKLDKGMGSVATILVQNGTLNVGDVIIAGTSVGKVRALLNEKGKNVNSAGPSCAVSVLGLSSVPNAGDEMYAVDEKMSKKVLSERMVREKVEKIKTIDNTVDSLMDRFKETEFKYYNVIIKGDVQGSVEALKTTIGSIENEEVKVRCIHGGVGAVNENDIMLASASNALIIAFNVKSDFKAKVLAEKYKVNIQAYRVIYEAVDYVTSQIKTMLSPKYKEVVTGHAEVRVIFKASKVGAIAGSYILDGKLSKNEQVRLLRKGNEVFAGTIATIQREKNEVKDIAAGFECGIVLNGFSAYEESDIIEAFILERIN